MNSVAAGGRVLGGGEVDARRAHQLADDDALGAVDDEGAVLGHQREVAHEDGLVLDLVRLLDDEVDLDLQRLGVGQVPGAALLLAELRLLEVVVAEVQLEILAGEVGDRGDLVEQLAKAGLDEPIERIGLGLDQVREGENLRDVREILTARGQLKSAGGLGQGHSGLLEKGMVEGMEGRGHAKGEYITRYRFVK